ncbi:MAG: thioredoxin family protein [Chlamydiota bacterium]|nr:thioredoxin family protein [Chlamydiota bacterium]
MAEENVEAIDDNNFHQIIKEGKVCVKFSATWCGPCITLAPIFNEVSQEMKKEEIRFYSLDIDGAECVSELCVTSVPTIILFRDGSEVARISGMQSAQAIIEKIKNAFN